MSLAADLYDDLVAAGETPQTARIFRLFAEQLDERVPRDVVRSHEARETELRLQKEIKEVEAKLTKEIKEVEAKLTKEIKDVEAKLTKEIKEIDLRIHNTELRLTKEIKDVEIRLTQLIGRQTWTLIGGVTTIATVFRILTHFGL